MHVYTLVVNTPLPTKKTTVDTPKRVTKLTAAVAADVAVSVNAAAAEATLALTCDRAPLQLKPSAWGTFSRKPTFHGLSQTLRSNESPTLTQSQTRTRTAGCWFCLWLCFRLRFGLICLESAQEELLFPLHNFRKEIINYAKSSWNNNNNNVR